MVDLFRALPVVIVWRSFIDPVEFSGAPLRGAEFRENGYIDPPSTRYGRELCTAADMLSHSPGDTSALSD
ncbi:hypothetical protein JG687_00007953 [Phytophthora cactorum]|uniref:Uncharacterized protein n=1 Tax=Phytophthora cactorum TaxID=29920 RepID=A0A8T1UFL8_9STRA|nr:hypothetical protein JG687_00007953 [Phytophthora cactorum]